MGLLALSLISLPHWATQLADNRLAAVGHSRLAGCLAQCAIRAAIVLSLLYSGVVWLSSTSSILDLVLNAAALGFIIDIDELLMALVPHHAAQMVAELEPLRLPFAPSRIYSLLMAAGFLAVNLSACIGYVLPNAERMIDVKLALCGGSLNFAVALNGELGLVLSVGTRASGENSMADVGLWARAVEELRGRSVAPVRYEESLNDSARTPQRSLYFGEYEESGSKFHKAHQWTPADWSEYMLTCEDRNYDVFPGGGGMFEAIRHGTGIDASSSSEWKPFRCGDFKQVCGSPRNYVLRGACPIACGCNDFASGLFLASGGSGCSNLCQASAGNRAWSEECADPDPGSNATSAAWKRYWREFGELLTALYGAEHPSVLIQAELAVAALDGCAGVIARWR